MYYYAKNMYYYDIKWLMENSKQKNG